MPSAASAQTVLSSHGVQVLAVASGQPRMALQLLPCPSSLLLIPHPSQIPTNPRSPAFPGQEQRCPGRPVLGTWDGAKPQGPQVGLGPLPTQCSRGL